VNQSSSLFLGGIAMPLYQKCALSLCFLCLSIALALFMDTGSFCAALPQDDLQKIEPSLNLPLDESHAISMSKLINFASEVLGFSLLYTDAEIMDHQFRFTAHVEMPRAKFQGFFERLLLSHGFIYFKFGEGVSALHTIERLSNRQREDSLLYLRSAIPMVPLDRIADYGDRGILISTFVPLKFIDSRNLMTSLTPWFPNQSTESVRPVENVNGLIITSYASKINFIAKLIQIMDRDGTEMAGSLNQKIAELERKVQVLEKRIGQLENR
jgi:type II secretory pathway component GspD/PulD (secretin)